MNRALVSEFKYTIKKAMQDGDFDRALVSEFKYTIKKAMQDGDFDRALVSEFKYTIKKAMQDGDFDRAQLAREIAFEKHDIDLLDYLVHPSLGAAA